MLTKEDDVEIHALAARGWTKAAIARHTGRDRKTVAKYLARPVGAPGREQAASCLEPFRGYLEARFADDPHVDATVLYRERCERATAVRWVPRSIPDPKPWSRLARTCGRVTEHQRPASA